MNILILNPGSRWLKSKVYADNGEVFDTQKIAIDDVVAQKKWFSQLRNIGKIGLRVVHGGDIEGPQLLDKKTRSLIEKFSIFAPLHNKKALQIIDLISNYFINIPTWCVFDTHFHRTLPVEAYTYPIPKELAKKNKIRRYGFHGIALESVYEQLQNRMEKEDMPMPKKLLMVHLGGGSSVTAVLDGKSVATSMGVTPLDGVMMITRSGSVDPDIQRVLNYTEGYDARQVSTIFNKESGFKGITGSTDTKQIIENAMSGFPQEQLAFSLYIRSIVETIFSYYGIMQGVDAMTLSGGIGFNNEYVLPSLVKWTEIIDLDLTNAYSFKADESSVIYTQIINL